MSAKKKRIYFVPRQSVVFEQCLAALNGTRVGSYAAIVPSGISLLQPPRMKIVPLFDRAPEKMDNLPYLPDHINWSFDIDTDGKISDGDRASYEEFDDALEKNTMNIDNIEIVLIGNDVDVSNAISFFHIWYEQQGIESLPDFYSVEIQAHTPLSMIPRLLDRANKINAPVPSRLQHEIDYLWKANVKILLKQKFTTAKFDIKDGSYSLGASDLCVLLAVEYLLQKQQFGAAGTWDIAIPTTQDVDLLLDLPNLNPRSAREAIDELPEYAVVEHVERVQGKPTEKTPLQLEDLFAMMMKLSKETTPKDISEAINLLFRENCITYPWKPGTHYPGWDGEQQQAMLDRFANGCPEYREAIDDLRSLSKIPGTTSKYVAITPLGKFLPPLQQESLPAVVAADNQGDLDGVPVLIPEPKEREKKNEEERERERRVHDIASRTLKAIVARWLGVALGPGSYMRETIRLRAGVFPLVIERSLPRSQGWTKLLRGANPLPWKHGERIQIRPYDAQMHYRLPPPIAPHISTLFSLLCQSGKSTLWTDRERSLLLANAQLCSPEHLLNTLVRLERTRYLVRDATTGTFDLSEVGKAVLKLIPDRCHHPVYLINHRTLARYRVAAQSEKEISLRSTCYRHIEEVVRGMIQQPMPRPSASWAKRPKAG